MPMTPKIKATNPKRKDRPLIIGIQEPRSARVPKMMARILRFYTLLVSFESSPISSVIRQVSAYYR